ncbi:flagellar protein [Selenomonas sp. AE3005]|jgi:ribosomal protein L32|uniref:flagellar protein n=1 Tax=Selenomonas sp. AE3005 TaxID=1485543 RepID=UPI00048641FD|nr:flagellar protein [Selenomonas sp. AE3005]
MAGKIKNCPMCGKLFNDTGHKVCMDCFEKIQEKEHEVVEYVREHRGAKIAEICEATKAPAGMIKKMIREGRFEQIGVKMTYPCEKCGAPIVTGKICKSCEDAARSTLQKQAAAVTAARQMAKADKGQGMYSKKHDE